MHGFVPANHVPMCLALPPSLITIASPDVGNRPGGRGGRGRDLGAEGGEVGGGEEEALALGGEVADLEAVGGEGDGQAPRVVLAELGGDVACL